MTSSDDAIAALTPGTHGMEPTDGASAEALPRDDGGDTPFQDAVDAFPRFKSLLAYLPVGATEDATDYDGILSYAVEWHAAIIGVAVGATAGTTGDTQLVCGLISTALGLGRINQQASETVTAHLVNEPWYAIAGIAVGYIAVRYGPSVMGGGV